MTARDLRGQWAFWREHLARRAMERGVAKLPPKWNSDLVRVLESRGQPQVVHLEVRFPRVNAIVTRSHEFAPAVQLRVAAQGSLLDPDDFWYGAVKAHELEDVTLDVDSGLVFSNGWVVSQSGSGHRGAWDTAFINGATVRVAATSVRGYRGAVAALGDATNHYHFLMETLPRALRARQVDPGVVFVTTTPPSAFASDRLAELGLSVDVCPAGSVLRPDRMILVEPEPRDRTHPAQMELLVETFCDCDEPGPSPDGAPVYISRRGSARSLAREELLEDWLREQGFDVLRLEELSFGEQVRRLHNTKLVVGPHGAGLANCVFMKPGGRVVELATGEWWSPVFRRIAAARGQQYELVPLPDTAGAPFGSAEDAISALDERGLSREP